MDGAELSNFLNQRAEEVCAHLLPAGKRVRDEWMVGDIYGTEGKRGKGTLNVRLAGPKAGIWKDWADLDVAGGSLISLWAAVKGVPVSEAFTQIKAFYRLEDERVIGAKPRKKLKPVPKEQLKRAGFTRAQDVNPAARYLEDERKIPREVLNLYRVLEQPPARWKDRKTGEDMEHGWRIGFPYLKACEKEPSGYMLVDVKQLDVERVDGVKVMRKPFSGCDNVLYGWQATDPRATALIIAEGEIDAMTWRAWALEGGWGKVRATVDGGELSAGGVDAMSVPLGMGAGGNQNWLDNEYEDLERYETILLAFDVEADPRKEATANAAINQLADRLGYHRCLRLNAPLGCKDANEARQKGATAADAYACLAAATMIDAGVLVQADTVFDEIIRRRTDRKAAGSVKAGFQPDWVRASGHRIVEAPGEVTIVYGYNGHGKSEFVRQMALEAGAAGYRTCIAGFEQPVDDQVDNMVTQITGCETSDPDWITGAITWLMDKVWWYPKIGAETVDKLISVFTYAHRRFGCTRFVIDSWMRIDMGGKQEDRNATESRVIQRLVKFAGDTRSHLEIVAHPRKTQSEQKPPDKMDLGGSGAISDNCHNLWTIHKDAKGGGLTNVFVKKNRNYGDEPQVTLKFDSTSRRFLPQHASKAEPFVRHPADPSWRRYPDNDEDWQ